MTTLATETGSKTVTVKGKEYILLPNPIKKASGAAILLIQSGDRYTCHQLKGYVGECLKIVGVEAKAFESGKLIITEHTMVAFTLASSNEPPTLAIKLSCFSYWTSITNLIKL